MELKTIESLLIQKEYKLQLVGGQSNLILDLKLFQGRLFNGKELLQTVNFSMKKFKVTLFVVLEITFLFLVENAVDNLLTL